MDGATLKRTLDADIRTVFVPHKHRQPPNVIDIANNPARSLADGFHHRYTLKHTSLSLDGLQNPNYRNGTSTTLRMTPLGVFGSRSSLPTSHYDSVGERGWPCLPPGFTRPTRHIHHGFHPFWGMEASICTPFHCNNGVNPLPHQHASAPFRKSEPWHLTGLQGPLNDRSFAPVPVLDPSSSPSPLVCHQYDYRLWVQYTHNCALYALQWTLII